MVTLRLLANPKIKARVTEGRAQAMIQSRHWRRDYGMTAKDRAAAVENYKAIMADHQKQLTT